jgi:zinc transporter ZupT
VFGISVTDYGLAASIAAACVSTAGLILVVWLGDWGMRRSGQFSAFAVGFLSVILTFHLAPEALSRSFADVRWMALGLGMSFVMGLVGWLWPSSIGKQSVFAVGFASTVGIAVHSFLDGVVYETLFVGEHEWTGFFAVIALLVHEFPEGVISFYLLRSTGYATTPAFLFAFIAASLTTIAGAFVARSAIGIFSIHDYAALLGVSTGALLYIAFGHLAVHARKAPNRSGYFWAMIGIVVGTISVIMRMFLETDAAHH